MTHPQVALGEIATLIRGITYKPSDVCEATTLSAVACMRTKNVQEDLDESDIVWIPASIIRNSSKYLNPGDILVSSANSWNLVGKGCWVPGLKYPASAGGFISILRGNSDTVDLRYLYHWFISPQTQAKLRSYSNKTTNISNLDHSRTLATEIPLPPLEEQRRIAAILDKASSIQSAAAERAARATAALYRSLLMEELSKMDADKVRLGDILEIARGGSPRPIQAFLTNEPSGINWIMIGDTVVGEKYITKTAKMIKPEGLSKTRLVKEGDLLLSNSMSFGRPYIMITDGAIHDGWLLLRGSAQYSSPDYLYHVLGSPLCYSQFLRAAAGATVKNLNTAIVSSVEIPLPAFKNSWKLPRVLILLKSKSAVDFPHYRLRQKNSKQVCLGLSLARADEK
jgi:type I restriction enzyme S subunit